MSPEAQRVAIAESLGWRLESTKDYDAFFFGDTYAGGATHDLLRAISNAGIHDYLNDLNACAEFERAMDREQARWYIAHLGNMLSSYGVEARHFMQFATATAPQRCEAYLRALGLWKETV